MGDFEVDKLPKFDDLELWLEEFDQKEKIDEYDRSMIRLAVRLAVRGRRFSSQRVQASQAALEIKNLTAILKAVEENEKE